MSIEIDDVLYYSAAEVSERLGISRQTLWRWRREGKIPAGHRFRDRRVLFTGQEVETIREFATRVEPIGRGDHTQLGLFRRRADADSDRERER